MLDIGWTELLVVAAVAVLVVGPKDLPKMLRQFGKTMGQVRRMANEFQSQFNEALKEAELDEVRKDIESVRSAASTKGMAQAFNPLKEAGDELKKSVESAATPPTNPTTPTVNDSESAPEAASAPAETGEPGTRDQTSVASDQTSEAADAPDSRKAAS